MRSRQLTILFGLGLGVGSWTAVNAETPRCNAVVTKRSVTPSQNAEKTWNIEFNVTVSGCSTTHGTFEYVVDLEANEGMRSRTVTGEFETNKSETAVVKIAYEAPSGMDLKNVRDISVKTCACGSGGGR
ncbi:MAG: hypothetical protein JJE39_07890 [Vicinamibacteria bacterium]|nr:hypothetical protein [Vicinamibacteria bacterium]